MAPLPRSGLFGFLLLLGSLLPPGGLAASRLNPASGSEGQPAALQEPAADGVEARLRRISAALREQAPAPGEVEESTAATDRRTADKLALVFVNGPAVGFANGGFRNGGWGNGGFRNGGWGNGGFRNGGFGNGGFRNGGWGNGGGWRNGGFLNRW